MNEFDFISKEKEDISLETKLYVKKCFDIIDLLHETMEGQNILQKDLALRLNKSEAEVSKWLNGIQNFTLKTLCKLEAALGQELVTVPCKRNIHNIIKTLTIQNFKTVHKSPAREFQKFERAKQENNSDHLPIAA